MAEFATEVEKLILSAVRKHLAGTSHNKVKAEGPPSLNDKELISAQVARVDVKRDHLAIQLSAESERDSAPQSLLRCAIKAPMQAIEW